MTSPVGFGQLSISVPLASDSSPGNDADSYLPTLLKIAAFAGVAFCAFSFFSTFGASAPSIKSSLLAAVLSLGIVGIYAFQKCCQTGGALSPRSVLEHIGRSDLTTGSHIPILPLSAPRTNMVSVFIQEQSVPGSNRVQNSPFIP